MSTQFTALQAYSSSVILQALAHQYGQVGVQVAAKQYTFNTGNFLGGDYEKYHFLRCDAVWLLGEPAFQKNIWPASSG